MNYRFSEVKNLDIEANSLDEAIATYRLNEDFGKTAIEWGLANGAQHELTVFDDEGEIVHEHHFY